MGKMSKKIKKRRPHRNNKPPREPIEKVLIDKLMDRIGRYEEEGKIIKYFPDTKYFEIYDGEELYETIDIENYMKFKEVVAKSF